MILVKASITTTVLILVMKVFGGQTLTCHEAEYEAENECCPMCLPGSRVRTDCTELQSTSCLPCVDGTYMNQPTGLKNCLTCTNCDKGSGLKTKSSCTLTSDTVCEPQEGFYCVEPSGNGCGAAQKHSSCKPGQYISIKGTASTDTVCSDCPNGTFSDGSFTSCQPHTQCETKNLQLLKPGTASADAECAEHSPDNSVDNSDNLITNNSVQSIWISVSVCVLLVAIVIVSALFWLKKIQLPCLDKRKNAANARQANEGGGETEQLQA